MQMEAAIKKYTSEIFLTEDDLYDADKKQPPRFVTQIKDQNSLTEMQSTKFECQLAPVGDPNMKVEWFFNGKPLPFSEYKHTSRWKASNIFSSLLQKTDSHQFTISDMLPWHSVGCILRTVENTCAGLLTCMVWMKPGPSLKPLESPESFTSRNSRREWRASSAFVRWKHPGRCKYKIYMIQGLILY